MRRRRGPARRAPRILYAQYTNPAGYPPLVSSALLLAEYGWDVRLVGVRGESTRTFVMESQPRIRVRLMPDRDPGPAQKLHFLLWAAWVLLQVTTWRPDWVYLSDSPAAPLGLALACAGGPRLVYHEHDAPAPGPAETFWRSLQAWSRRRVLRRAELCLAPNAARGALLVRDGAPAQRCLTVWNCPLRAEVGQPRPAWRGPELWLYFHGSIGPSLLPLALVDALALLPDAERLRVVGYETIGARGYLAAFLERARRHGVAHRLELCGPVFPRSALLARARQSDVGLLFLDPGPSSVNHTTMAGASVKLFDYLASGLAVLAPDRPEWHELVTEPGYGLPGALEDPAGIAAAVETLLADPRGMRAMGERGRQRVLAEWNYDTTFRPVLERLREGGGR